MQIFVHREISFYIYYVISFRNASLLHATYTAIRLILGINQTQYTRILNLVKIQSRIVMLPIADLAAAVGGGQLISYRLT